MRMEFLITVDHYHMETDHLLEESTCEGEKKDIVCTFQ